MTLLASLAQSQSQSSSRASHSTHSTSTHADFETLLSMFQNKPVSTSNSFLTSVATADSSHGSLGETLRVGDSLSDSVSDSLSDSIGVVVGDSLEDSASSNSDSSFDGSFRGPNSDSLDISSLESLGDSFIENNSNVNDNSLDVTLSLDDSITNSGISIIDNSLLDTLSETMSDSMDDSFHDTFFDTMTDPTFSKFPDHITTPFPPIVHSPSFFPTSKPFPKPPTVVSSSISNSVSQEQQSDSVSIPSPLPEDLDDLSLSHLLAAISTSLPVSSKTLPEDSSSSIINPQQTFSPKSNKPSHDDFSLHPGWTQPTEAANTQFLETPRVSSSIPLHSDSVIQDRRPLNNQQSSLQLQGGVDFSEATRLEDGRLCVIKEETVETVRKDPVLECTHKNMENCHYTYITKFNPAQQQQCVENFVKSCQITFRPEATRETVRKCYRPQRKVCNGQGPRQCNTEYETSCTTRYVENSPGKYVGDTQCEKLPVSVCGSGCIVVEAPEECHDKEVDTLVDVPEEVCDLNPQKTCRLVTRLVPSLKPRKECTIVPKETCHFKLSQPTIEKKPLRTEWCQEDFAPVVDKQRIEFPFQHLDSISNSEEYEKSLFQRLRRQILERQNIEAQSGIQPESSTRNPEQYRKSLLKELRRLQKDWME